MQVDPIKPTLKAPGITRLKLKCDKLLSNFAFKFNLRRYIMGLGAPHGYYQLNSTSPTNPVKCKYCGLRFYGVHDH